MKNAILFLVLILVFICTSAEAQTMQDYTCNPVFPTPDIVPNVLFVVDSSGSMLCNAYPDPPGGG